MQRNRRSVQKKKLRYIQNLRRKRTGSDRKSGIYKIDPKTFFFRAGKENFSTAAAVTRPDNIPLKAAYALSAVTAGIENTPLSAVALAAAAQQTYQRISGVQYGGGILFFAMFQMLRNTGRRKRDPGKQHSADSRNRHTQYRPQSKAAKINFYSLPFHEQ